MIPAVDVPMPSQAAISAAMRSIQVLAGFAIAILAIGIAVKVAGGTLATRLCIDVLSGCLAAVAVSPFVALVDGAVARSLANKTPPTLELWTSVLELARAPRALLFRSDFYFTAFVYIVTYLTANISATLRAGELLRLGLITGANMLSGLKKDAYIAMTNPRKGAGAAGPVGRRTLALFCARDVNAIGASFVLPRLLAPHVSRALPHLGGAGAALACQIVAPPICELLNTNVHLLALDVYNRPRSSAADRLETISRQYPCSVLVRVVRVLVAFSLGGIGNRIVRLYLLRALAVG